MGIIASGTSDRGLEGNRSHHGDLGDDADAGQLTLRSRRVAQRVV